MKKKILVIDDDPVIVDYLVSVFTDNGFAACSASNAEEGLKTALAEKPDLITLDLDMPGEWGPRFYRKMNKEPGIRNTPVIVVSGLSGNQYAVPKAVASVTKPFDPDKLVALVTKTLKE